MPARNKTKARIVKARTPRGTKAMHHSSRQSRDRRGRFKHTPGSGKHRRKADNELYSSLRKIKGGDNMARVAKDLPKRERARKHR